MVCKKCGYEDKKNKKIFGYYLCSICYSFAPLNITEFQEYITEKLDWKALDTFRKFSQGPGKKQKIAMSKKAKLGGLVTRAPLGYDVINGKLVPNQDSSRVHSLFKTFLNRSYSLNSLAKNFALSTNGLKKVLTNRTYLGEIKFDGRIHKGDHQALISPEIFYAVQRKLKENYIRSKK